MTCWYEGGIFPRLKLEWVFFWTVIVDQKLFSDLFSILNSLGYPSTISIVHVCQSDGMFFLHIDLVVFSILLLPELCGKQTLYHMESMPYYTSYVMRSTGCLAHTKIYTYNSNRYFFLTDPVVCLVVAIYVTQPGHSYTMTGNVWCFYTYTLSSGHSRWL